MNSSYLSSLRFSNHHYNFFHWVKYTFPRMPIYPFAMICVPIFPVKIWPVACVIPPTSAPNWSTVTTWIIIVTVVRSEEHPAMVLQAVSWNSNEQWTGIKVFSLMIVSWTTTVLMNLKAFEYIANDINVEKKTVVHIPRSQHTFIIVNTKFSHYQTHFICKEIYENFTQTILPNNINWFKSAHLFFRNKVSSMSGHYLFPKHNGWFKNVVTYVVWHKF